MEGYSSYIFLGVGVAISVLGFFLKKEAQKTIANERKLNELEVRVSTNEALDEERWQTANKLLEDRRDDIKSIFTKLNK